MELSVYHLAIITVIAFLFFSLVLLCHTIMNKPPNSTGGGGCIKGRDRLKERFEGKGALR